MYGASVKVMVKVRLYIFYSSHFREHMKIPNHKWPSGGIDRSGPHKANHKGHDSFRNIYIYIYHLCSTASYLKRWLSCKKMLQIFIFKLSFFYLSSGGNDKSGPPKANSWSSYGMQSYKKCHHCRLWPTTWVIWERDQLWLNWQPKG